MAQTPYSYGVPDNAPADTAPDVYQRLSTSPAAFGAAGAQQMRQAAQDLGQAGNTLAQTTLDQQNRYNQIVVDDYQNKYAESSRKLLWGNPDDPDPVKQKGLFGLTGEDAMIAGRGIIEQLGKTRDELKSALRNDVQKLGFDQATRRMLDYQSAQASSHITAQMKQYGDAVNKAKVNNAVQDASLSYNSDGNITAQLESARQGAVQGLQGHAGQNPKQDLVRAAVLGADTAVIVGAVEGALTQRAYGRAKEILDRFGTMIAPAARDHLATRVTGMAEGAAVSDAATAYLGSATSTFSAEAVQRANTIRDGLIRRGLDQETATAFAANALHESSANPGVQPGDGGASHGIFQWRDDRVRRFQLANGGRLPEQTSLDTQLDYVTRELLGPESNAFQQINAAKGPEAKAAAVSQFYLRPKDVEGEKERRSATAAMLAGNGGDATGTQAIYDGAQEQAKKLFPDRPDLQNQFTSKVWQDIERRNILRNQAETAQKQQRVEQVNAAMSDYVPQIMNAPQAVSLDKIINDPRLAQAPGEMWRLQSMLKEALKGDAEKLPEVSHTTATQLLDSMRRPAGDPQRVDNLNPVYQAYIDGKLTNADFSFITQQFEQMRTPEGQKLNESLRSLYSAVKPTIEKSNPMMGLLDLTGPSNYLRYQRDVEDRIDAYRKAGKNPSDLFDYKNPQWVGSPAFLAPYQTSIPVSVENWSKQQQQTAPVPTQPARPAPAAAPATTPAPSFITPGSAARALTPQGPRPPLSELAR